MSRGRLKGIARTRRESITTSLAPRVEEPRRSRDYISASFTVSMSTYSRMRRILPPSISNTKQYSLR